MEKILLVDDDTDLLLPLKASLVKHGFQVTTLSNSAVVQLTSDKVQPALVILDINMGKYDGWDICKEFKSHTVYNPLPVVLYSARVNDSVALDTCKADLFLQKPVTAEMPAGNLIKLKRA